MQNSIEDLPARAARQNFSKFACPGARPGARSTQVAAMTPPPRPCVDPEDTENEGGDMSPRDKEVWSVGQAVGGRNDQRKRGGPVRVESGGVSGPGEACKSRKNLVKICLRESRFASSKFASLTIKILACPNPCVHRAPRAHTHDTRHTPTKLNRMYQQMR